MRLVSTIACMKKGEEEEKEEFIYQTVKYLYMLLNSNITVHYGQRTGGPLCISKKLVYFSDKKKRREKGIEINLPSLSGGGKEEKKKKKKTS